MGKINRLVLIMPNFTWFNYRPWIIPPYTLGILRSVIPDKYEIEIIDANNQNLSKEQVAERIEKFKPDLVAICSMSLEYSKIAHAVAEIVKLVNPEIFTVMGGVYCTTTPELAIRDKNIDFLILGEGERRFPILLNAISDNSASVGDIDGIGYRNGSKSVINPIKTYIKDLDLLPLPAYDKVNFKNFINKTVTHSNPFLPRFFPYAVTSTSRGCPFSCIYCTTASIDGKAIRYKSAEKVLEEIDWLVSDYGIKEIIFLDDNLIMDRERIIKILKGLIKRDYNLYWKSVNLATFKLDDELLNLMKESKVYQLRLAIESGNQYVLSKILKKPLNLKKIPKIIKKAKNLELEIAADFIIGIPGETWDQIRETMQFAENINIDMVTFHIATPLPKTELYNLALKNNFIPTDFSFDSFGYFGFAKGVISTNEFNPENLHMLRALEWDRINFKTKERKEKFAKMNGITLEELEKWRKKTIENLGLYIPKR